MTLKGLKAYCDKMCEAGYEDLPITINTFETKFNYIQVDIANIQIRDKFRVGGEQVISFSPKSVDLIVIESHALVNELKKQIENLEFKIEEIEETKEHYES